MKTFIRCCLTLIGILVFILNLSNCSIPYEEVEILREWRGKSKLSGYYVIIDKGDIPEGFPKVDIDFGKEMLIAAFHGPISAAPTIKQSISIRSISENGKIKVTVKKVVSKTWYKVHYDPPRPEVYHLVSIPKSIKPISIYENGELVAISYADTWPKGGEVVDGLQATIKSDKNIYRLDEAITINFRLKNFGNTIINLIDYHLGDLPGLSLQIDGLGAQKIEERNKLGIGGHMLKSINPKESFLKKVWIGTPTSQWSISKEGKYKITATFQAKPDLFKKYRDAFVELNPSDADSIKRLEPWIGRLISNTIEIQVVK